MNSKRRSSPRTKQQSSATRSPRSQPSASPLLQPADSAEVTAETHLESAAESDEIHQIQGHSEDWVRLHNLAQQAGLQELSEPDLLSQLLTWAETQAVEDQMGDNLDLSQAVVLKKTLGLASQLIVSLNSLSIQLQHQQHQQHQFNEALVKVLQGMTSHPAASRSGTTAATRRMQSAAKGNFVEFDSKDLKKSHAKGSAEEKLRRAFQAIVAYNETEGRTQSDKWAINQNALAELTGCNRPAIKQFLKQYGDEIEAHHHHHGLLARHNYAHGKNGVKITDVIHW